MPGHRLLATMLLVVLLLSPLPATSASPAPDSSDQVTPRDRVGTTTSTYPTRLTNNCRVSPRGLPRCGSYLGMSYGGNDDPTELEDRVGRLGVRRTYFRADQIRYAVRTARADVAAGRLPWLSFKMPFPWWRMANGRGNGWAHTIVRRLNRLDGPVWIAFHHEPEGDGRIQKWRLAQEQLGPIVRRASDNVGFTAILTGWHQFYGKRRYRLRRIWPRGIKVDVAGFDVYNAHGMFRNGQRMDPTDMDGDYFLRISRWARHHNTRWGLGETGYTDYAARRTPEWIDETHAALVNRGGVAMSYFNSKLNSVAPWHLDMQVKEDDFADAMKGTPRLRR